MQHYDDVIMTTMASQITNLAVVYSSVYSDADQRKHQSSASLAFVWGIHRDKGPVTRKMFPFDDVIMTLPPRAKYEAPFVGSSKRNDRKILRAESYVDTIQIFSWWIAERSINYHQTSNIRRTLAGNKHVDHSDVVGAAPIQLHPHSRLKAWFQWIGQRQLQKKTIHI